MRTAVEAVQHNKLRASLTSLGILFGVASVIAMLAIGRAPSVKSSSRCACSLEQRDDHAAGGASVRARRRSTRQEGDEVLTRPHLRGRPGDRPGRSRGGVTSAEVVLNTSLTREGLRRSGKLVGVDTTYFRSRTWRLPPDDVHSAAVERGLPVAIIGMAYAPASSRPRIPSAGPSRSARAGHRRRRAPGSSPDAANRAAPGIRDANMDV